MISREELMKTEEFWFETIQNEIYRQIETYLAKNNLTRSQFAVQLGVSKGYVSQILNGNYNASLRKLIELSLAVGKAPVIEFIPLDSLVSGKDMDQIPEDPIVPKVAESIVRYKVKNRD